MAKIERKLLAHFIDTSFNGTTASYARLGKDLEEYAIELNADIETKKNILGESSTNVKGYDPSTSADPYYAYEGDALFEKLLGIVNDRSTGSDLETTVVDVHLWDESTTTTGTYTAWKEDVVVVPTSIGGDGGGVNIPFETHYVGNRVKGTFVLSTKTFTADTASSD